jgi:hypothetical protein
MGRCSDQFGVDSGNNQCKIEKYAYQGSNTDTDGVLLDGPYAGEEIGKIDSIGTHYAQIPSDQVFSSVDVANLRNLFAAPAGSDTVILDAGKSQQGIVAINIDRQSETRSAIVKLMDPTSAKTLFTGTSVEQEKKRAAVFETLRREYQAKYPQDALPTTLGEQAHTVGTFSLTGVGLIVGGFLTGLGFAYAGHLINKWFPPDPPAGGAGAGGGSSPLHVVSGGEANNHAARNALIGTGAVVTTVLVAKTAGPTIVKEGGALIRYLPGPLKWAAAVVGLVALAGMSNDAKAEVIADTNSNPIEWAIPLPIFGRIASEPDNIIWKGQSVWVDAGDAEPVVVDGKVLRYYVHNEEKYLPRLKGQEVK